jgi:hypothetical protein
MEIMARRKVVFGCWRTRFFAALRMTRTTTVLLSYFDKAVRASAVDR